MGTAEWIIVIAAGLVTMAIAWFVLFGIGRLFRPTDEGQERGKDAERLARSELERLPKALYTSYHGVYLPRPNGNGMTEIDHIVISRYGVFVIETKWVGGQMILGGAEDQYWTKYYNERTEHSMRNPILQNRGHVRAVTRFLRVKPKATVPLVYLPGPARPDRSLGPEVVDGRALADRILEYSQERLAPDRVSSLVAALDAHERSYDKKRARKQHLDELNRRHG